MQTIFFPFSPIIQDENQANFCKMLDKSDSLITLEMTATQVWSHFRAFIAFPFTILVDSYFGQIKILDCQINDQFATLNDLQSNLDSSQILEINLDKNSQENLPNLSDNSLSTKNLQKSLLSNSQTESQSKFLNNSISVDIFNSNNISNIPAEKITQICQKDSWIRIKITKKNLTFLICKDQTLLQINKIGLSDGKKIDFSGYNFE